MLSAETQYAVLYWTLLSLVILNFFKNQYGKPRISRHRLSAILLLIFMILIIGVRDWMSPEYGDSGVYGRLFSDTDTPVNRWSEKSKFWGYLYYFWNTSGLSPELFFIVSAIFYCIPSYVAATKFSSPYSIYTFLLFFACSFGWYSFGVNGIRNGWAFAMLTWAFIAYYDKRIELALACMLFAWCIHGSAIIAIGGMATAYFYHKPKQALYIWFGCVILSLFLGTFAQNFFTTIDFVNQDGEEYLTGNMDDTDKFSHSGFRWDFLLFSFIPIVWGVYCCKKLDALKIQDIFYKLILCSYIYANAVWILVIRSGFSNRIAQVSWWMLPIVVAYPLFRMPIFSSRARITGFVLLLYYAFVFFMYIIY